MQEKWMLVVLGTSMITLPGCMMGQLAFELTGSVAWAWCTIGAFALGGFLMGCYITFWKKEL